MLCVKIFSRLKSLQAT